MVFYTKALNTKLPKRMTMAMLLAANAFAAWADSKLTIADMGQVIAGNEYTVQVVLNNEEDILSMTSDLILPEGMELVKPNADEYFVWNTDVLTGDYTKAGGYADGVYKIFIGGTATSKIPANSNPKLLEFTVKTDINMKGDAEIILKNQKISTTDRQKIQVAEEKVTVNVEDPDDVLAVFSISAEQALTILPKAEPTTITVALNNNIPVAGLDARFQLPKGLKMVEGSLKGTERSNGFTLSANELGVIDGVHTGLYQLRIFVGSTQTFTDNEGPVFSFQVEADNELAAESEINFTNVVVVKKNSQEVKADDIQIAISNPNAAAKDAADADLKALNEALQEAKDGVNPAVRADEKYTEDTNDKVLEAEKAAEEAVKALQDKVDETFDDVTLWTPEVQAEVEALKEAAEEAIEAVVKAGEDAKALLDQLIENDAVNDALAPQIEALEQALADAIAAVAENDPLVADNYAGTFGEIAQAVEDLKNGIAEKYNKPNRNLTAADQEEAEKTIQDLTAKIAETEATADAYQDLQEVLNAYEAAKTPAEESAVVDEPEVVEALAAAKDAVEALQNKIDNLDPYLGADYEAEQTAAEEAIAAIPVAVQEATDRVEAEGLLSEGQSAAEEAINAIREEVANDLDVVEAKEDVENKLAALQDAVENGKPFSENIEDIRAKAEDLQDAIENLKTTEQAAKDAAEAFAKEIADAVINNLKDALQQEEEKADNNEYVQTPEVIKNLVDEAEQAAEDAVKAIEDFVAENEGDLTDPENSAKFQELVTDAEAAIQNIPTVVDELTARKDASQAAYDKLIDQVNKVQDAFDDYVRRITIGDGKNALDDPEIAAEKEAIQKKLDDLKENLKKANEVEVSLDENSSIDDELAEINGDIDQFIADVAAWDKQNDHNAQRYAQLNRDLNDVRDLLDDAEEAIRALENVGGLYEDEIQALEDRLQDLRDELNDQYLDRALELDTELDDLKPLKKDIAALVAEAQAEEQAYQDNKKALEDAVDALNDALDQLKDDRDKLVDDNEFIDDEDVADIDQQIADLEKAIEDIEDALKDADDNKQLTDQDTLDALNKAIEDAQKATEEGEKAVEDQQNEYTLHHQTGDVNDDTIVTVSDVVTLLNGIFNPSTLPVQSENPEEFARFDVNGDNSINVVDATAIINIINNSDYSRVAENVGTETFEAQATMQNGVQNVALNLSSARSYVAYQLDVVLPEGTLLDAAELTSRTEGHTLKVIDLGNNTKRVFVYSMNNSVIEGNDGAVLNLRLIGNGEAQIQNVIFGDQNAVAHEFTVEGAQTTGISGVKAEAGVMDTIYSLGGRVMNAVKKGINIIRRADGTTQKVVK